MRGLWRGVRSLFSSASGMRDRLVGRWLFLRALGGIYLSAFFALLFQVRGLIGPQGVLPAGDYLQRVRSLEPAQRLWLAPTLLWLSASDRMLLGISWTGLIAAVLLVANVLPRWMLLICFVCFLSFVAAAQDFSGYQSDGMLLEAGFLALFLAPRGFRPGLGARTPPPRAAVLLLLWEWFRIYFQSGVVKLESGDPTWRNLTAMYEYYQNGPLPTWVGWHLENAPHWFARSTAGLTLAMELGLIWLAFFGRRARLVCFWIVTVWQAVVIATANYAFLNYLVLVLAFLLLDDEVLLGVVPRRWRPSLPGGAENVPEPAHWWTPAGVGLTAVALSWVAYATVAQVLQMFWPRLPLPEKPVALLEPFRIANSYGLFAVMTPHRYEIEFQGSDDGVHWTAYPFRFKPQDVHERPGIYAPYQPRFDWNLWFASLGPWQENVIVPRTEVALLGGDPAVLSLFRGDPFAAKPPKYVRAVLWQYWFTTPAEKRATGDWWRRQLLGTYAPTLTPAGDGKVSMVEPASLMGPPQ